MEETIGKHSDEIFIKAFSRWVLIDYILDSGNWIDLENKLKKTRNKKCPIIMEGIFNEFKFYNCVLKIEYNITDSLNDFLIKENKIRNWNVLENKFLEKTRRNLKKTKKETERIIKEQTEGDVKRILTPSIMLYYAGFGLGDLIDYVRSFTNDFFQKEKLVSKLTEFNRCRKIIIHNLLTSRVDVEEKIKEGIIIGREIINLIEEIRSKGVNKLI